MSGRLKTLHGVSSLTAELSMLEPTLGSRVAKSNQRGRDMRKVWEYWLVRWGNLKALSFSDH